jgi:ferrous iron transport protein A
MAAAQDNHSPTPSTLGQLPIGTRAKIIKVNANRFIVRRLLGLGLRAGSEISVLHHRGKGVVIAIEGNRIALGDGVADMLLIEPIGAVDS